MANRRKIKPNIPAEEKETTIIEQLAAQKSSPTAKKANAKETVRITLDIPKPLHAQIKQYTKARGQTIKGYLLFLASQDIEK